MFVEYGTYGRISILNISRTKSRFPSKLEKSGSEGQLNLWKTKIAKPTVFQVVLRGIGNRFQSAITAPRMNLTGYGNATAQT